MKNNMVQVFAKQEEIIRIQSGIIDEMFILLSNHMTVEEMDGIIGKIEKVSNEIN